MNPFQHLHVRNAMATPETETRVENCYKVDHVGGPALIELPRNSAWRCRVASTAANKADKSVRVKWFDKESSQPATTDAALARPSTGSSARLADFPADQDFYICCNESEVDRRVIALLWDGAADTTVIMVRLDQQKQ